MSPDKFSARVLANWALLIVLGLILVLDHCRKPHEAGQLAGFVQGAGFLINAVSPWMTGWIRELTGSFISAWWVLVVVVLSMLVLTRIFSPASHGRTVSA